MSIQEMVQKIKAFLRFPPADLLIVALVVLVGFAGFGLGRLSRVEEAREPVRITAGGEAIAVPVDYPAARVLSEGEQSSGSVVASKSGSKYHFPWCAGAQQIAPQNRIEFASAEAARAAGYTPAANCKGLE